MPSILSAEEIQCKLNDSFFDSDNDDSDEENLKIARRELYAADSCDKVIVSILDTGSGYNRYQRQQLFDKAKNQGLALCKQIAQELDGDLIVQSHEGEGTRFSFSVCLDELEIGGSKNQQICSDMSVLIVDSDILNAMSLAQLIMSLGVSQIDKCHSFDEAIRFAR